MSERRAAFLAELTSRVTRARDEQGMLRAGLDAVVAELGAARAFFAEGDETTERVVVSALPGDNADATIRTSFALQQLGGVGWWRSYSRGDVAVEQAPEQGELPPELASAGECSYAIQALERAGGWRVTLTVTQCSPRVWRQDELWLLSDVLARVWAAVERARTEAESERRQRLYETTLSNTPDLIYVFDLNHRFTYANAALLDAWGRSPHEVIGKNCLEVGYPEWQATLHDTEIDQVISSKHRVHGEVPFKGAQGQRIHDYIFVPILGADGEVEAIAGTTRDVTALKQAERLMAGQAQSYGLMIRGAPLAEVLESLCDIIDQQATERLCASILLMQDDGRHLRPAAGRHMPTSWSRAVDPWAIGPQQGACGSAAHARKPIISPDIETDAVWSPELRELALQHGFRACWSTPIFSSGGSAVLGTLALYYTRVHHPDPSEMRLVEMITRSAGIAIERQRSEEGFKRYSEWLRLLWETAAVLLTTEDPEALVRSLFVMIGPDLDLEVFLNHMQSESGQDLELFSFAGISSELAGAVAKIQLGSPLCGNLDQTREPYTVSYIQSSHELEHELLKSLGLHAYACVPLIANDRLLGTLAFGSKKRDHFEVDEVEFLRTVARYMTVAYERLRLVRELRDADRKKDDFIALLAHELRNPLAPLRNGLAVMRLASGDAAAMGRARAIMERQLSHMVRLIEDLLDVSRISLNKMQLRRACVALSEVVSSALETARPAIDNAEHQLEVLLPSEPILLDADLTRLAQVFGNLLTNAAKYTPKRGLIVLRVERDEAGVVISVEDNGIGLRPESLRSIFGMFSQVDHSFERTTGGLGIGLALVKGLTEMHGGSVRAESAGPGQGSRFVVHLPTLNAEAGERARAVSVRPSADKPRRRILVADDNRDAVDSLATMLRLAGNEVHTAHDGMEAVERAEAIQPDVVLMDVGMPRLNGYEATRRIRSHAWGQRIVVIALTGWGQESDRQLSRDAGCDGHLVKPVDPGQLDELMSELCGRRSEPRPHSTLPGAAAPAGGRELAMAIEGTGQPSPSETP